MEAGGPNVADWLQAGGALGTLVVTVLYLRWSKQATQAAERQAMLAVEAVTFPQRPRLIVDSVVTQRGASITVQVKLRNVAPARAFLTEMTLLIDGTEVQGAIADHVLEPEPEDATTVVFRVDPGNTVQYAALSGLTEGRD